MRIVHGQALINTLRQTADTVSTRLWVAAHYVGGPSSIRSILGTRWLRDRTVSVRLLIDSTHLAGIDAATLSLFRDRGEVRVLPGLHAKLYICDGMCFLTSANLTETAFAMRYEVGMVLGGAPATDLMEVFEQWWDMGMAFSEEAASLGQRKDDVIAKTLIPLWTMPSDPGEEY